MNRTNIRKRLACCPSTRIIEGLSFATAAWWAYLLSLPAPSTLFATNPVFLQLSQRAPETYWLGFLGAGAIAHLYALCWGGTVARFLALATGVGIWTFIAADLARASPHHGRIPISTGFGVYTAMAIACLVAMCILARCFSEDLATKARERATRQEVTEAA